MYNNKIIIIYIIQIDILFYKILYSEINERNYFPTVAITEKYSS